LLLNAARFAPDIRENQELILPRCESCALAE
jgi:hypothetical protein